MGGDMGEDLGTKENEGIRWAVKLKGEERGGTKRKERECPGVQENRGRWRTKEYVIIGTERRGQNTGEPRET